MLDPRTPILVGVADVTDMATPAAAGRSPCDLVAQAAQAALDDTGAAAGLREAIDTVAMVRQFADTSHRFANVLGHSSNPPRSIGRRLGLANVATEVYTYSGGNMPQLMVDQFAEQIAAGQLRAALICGGEALRTQQGLQRAGLDTQRPGLWAEEPGGAPTLVGDPRRGWSDLEDRHGLRAAIVQYPMIENAIRGARGRSLAQHLPLIAELMAGFAAVAAANPLATRREAYSAQRLAKVDADNRWIGLPYPKLMNANAYIDQSAALVMTSVAEAQRLGIDPAQWIYLHGCAEGHDHWYVSQRPEPHRSPAMHAVARQALDMAGKTLADMRFFDIYSCFSSAVEVACAESGLAEDDPRGLTVTGGLPFFGGPGNNYVTHSIAEMVRRLRGAPGSYGLVSANGNYLTKHAWAVYASVPTDGPWRREPPAKLQARLDALPQAPLVEAASGRAVIETYTVMHGRDGPASGHLFGRLADSGQRFVAVTPSDPATLADLQDHEGLGRPGMVSHLDGVNTFVPDRA